MLRERKFTAALGALMTTFIYFITVLDEHVYAFVRLHVRSYNIFIYAIGVLLFFVAYYSIFKNEKLATYLEYWLGRVWDYIAVHSVAIVILGFVVLLFNIVFDDIHSLRGDMYVFFAKKKYKIFFAISAFAALVNFVESKNFRYKAFMLKVFSWLAVTFSICVTVAGISHHADALTYNAIINNEATFSEIYNLYYGEPFSMTQFGIYGRYAFFYVPLLKVMDGGMSMQNIIILHALFACLIVLSFVYFIARTVRNPLVRFMFFLCMSFLWGSMTVVTYQAVVRFVPGALMFFWLGWNYGRPLDYKRVLLGYLIGVIGIVWNLEFGLAAVFSWAVYVNWLEYTQGEKRSLTSIIFFVIRGIGGLVATFIVAWFFAGAMNVVFYHGEVLSFKNFTIPHTNSAYMVNSLQSFLLKRGELPWLCVIGISLLSLGVFGVVSSKGISVGRNGVIVFAATAVLAGMVYYINRFYFGLIFMIYFPGLVLLALLADRILEASAKRLKDCDNSVKEFLLGIRGGVFFLTGALTFCVVLHVGYITMYRFQTPNNLEEIREGERFLVSMRGKVPVNTPAAGRGMTEIYNRLGWDTGYHLTDAPYQTKEAVTRYEEILLDGKSKVICMEHVNGYVKIGMMMPDIHERMEELYDKVYIGNIDKSDYWYLIKK